MTEYARSGYAFLFLDMRGNGGETPGRPLNLDDDFGRFTSGLTPQYYSCIGDVILVADYLGKRYHVPVYVVGSSNGGRYAAIAAALDPEISGYIGISTSGFGSPGNAYAGDARRFLLSVDPDTYITRIAPRPVLIFHAQLDPVIPLEQGKALYDSAGEPKQFIVFNGTHGINSEVDREIFTFLGSRT
jgi:hypothetical protein